MSAYVDVAGEWALETLNRQGWLRSDIELNPVESPVPPEFTTHRVEAYRTVLVEKIEQVVEQGDVPCLAINGGIISVSVSDSDIVVRKTHDPVETDVISSRPPLYSSSGQMNEETIERVFWDGETVVAWPTGTNTEKLTLQGYQDTYSGTLAAASNVEAFPIEVLPFAMNITVLPVLTDDEPL